MNRQRFGCGQEKRCKKLQQTSPKVLKRSLFKKTKEFHHVLCCKTSEVHLKRDGAEDGLERKEKGNYTASQRQRVLCRINMPGHRQFTLQRSQSVEHLSLSEEDLRPQIHRSLSEDLSLTCKSQSATTIVDDTALVDFLSKMHMKTQQRQHERAHTTLTYPTSAKREKEKRAAQQKKKIRSMLRGAWKWRRSVYVCMLRVYEYICLHSHTLLLHLHSGGRVCASEDALQLHRCSAP